MSKKNRKRVYNKLIAEGKLSQDDGALEKEFGAPKQPYDKPKPKPKPEVK